MRTPLVSPVTSIADVTHDMTPFEEHDGIWVKREDLSSPPPGPLFSKIRGVLAHLAKRPEPVIGVLDTLHSRGGWAVSHVCRALGKQAVVFYPEFKTAPGMKESQIRSRELGALIYALDAGRSAILYHRAKAFLADQWPNSYMVPNALKLPESITETAEEVLRSTPPALLAPEVTWLVPASSGTIAAGVLLGLRYLTQVTPQVIFHMGYTRPEAAVRRYVQDMLSVHGPVPPFAIVDEGFAYRDAVQTPNPPFPCSPYYDRKTWRWIHAQRDLGLLQGPVVFWNVG